MKHTPSTIAIVLALLWLSILPLKLFAQNSIPAQTDTATTASFGVIKGTVVDERKDPMINAYTRLFQKDNLVAGVITNIDGEFTFNSVASGSYNVMVYYRYYDTAEWRGVTVNPGMKTMLKIKLNKSKDAPKHEGCKLGCPPLLDPYEPTKKTYYREDIQRMPMR